MERERPKWQIFLMTYAIAFVVITAIGLFVGDPIGKAVAGGILRGLLFGTVVAFVLIGMTKVNRSYAEQEAKHSHGDEDATR